jgi:DNA-binding beta-propeller fold protein YncE
LPAKPFQKITQARSYVTSIIAGFGANDLLNAPGMSFMEEDSDLHSFQSPRSAAVDHNRNMYVSVDDAKNYIKKISLTTGKIEMFGVHNEVDASAASALPQSPSAKADEEEINRQVNGMAIDPAGNVYFADFTNCVIRFLDAKTKKISTYAGKFGECGYSGDEGKALETKLSGPTDVALSSDGILFVADTGNGVIRRIDTSNAMMTTFYGNHDATAISQCSQKTSASDKILPYALTLDHHDNLFIGDNKCNVVLKVSTDRSSSVITGAGTSEARSLMKAKDAQFGYISGLSYDNSKDALYITDKFHNVVYELKNDEIQPLVGAEAGLVQADLNRPHGVALDRHGRALLIANTANHNIVKIAEQ